MKKTNSIPYDPDDIVTIEVARVRLGSDAPASRQSFHDAVKRGDLQKIDGHPGREVQFRWGVVERFVAEGGFSKRRGKKVAIVPESLATTETPGIPAAVAVDDATIHPAGSPVADGVAIHEVPAETAMDVIKDVENILAGLSDHGDGELIKHIKDFAARVEGFTRKADEIGACALTYAWACGKLLNQAKESISHGGFMPWVDKHLTPVGFGVRTCQRYMKLARKWPELHALVEATPSLMEAYEASGIIRGPKTSADGDEESGEDSTADSSTKSQPGQKLLASFSSLQKNMDHFLSSGAVLSSEDIEQMKLALDEINRFWQQIAASVAAESQPST